MKFLIGLLILGFVVLLWVAAIVVYQGSKRDSPAPAPVTAVGEKSENTRATIGATPAERLVRAKSLIEKEEFSGARSELLVIEASAPQYREARKLLTRINQLEEAKQRSQKAAIEKVLVGARQEYAEELERKMLKEFHDMYVRTSGPDRTTITFRYVLMSRPIVYNLVNDSAFMERLRSLGFKKAVFTDGYDQTWTQEVG